MQKRYQQKSYTIRLRYIEKNLIFFTFRSSYGEFIYHDLCIYDSYLFSIPPYICEALFYSPNKIFFSMINFWDTMKFHQLAAYKYNLKPN